METLTLSNPTHVLISTGQIISSINNTQHQHMSVNMNDISDLPSNIQEEIVSIPKEMILISLVSQEQALYNPKHVNYRNTARKDQKWMEIAENVGWPENQCKAKWKAMRDQYCRELKRSKFNIKANVKWKYFKDLEFLRPYALSRNYRPRCSNNNNSNNTTTINASFQSNNASINSNSTNDSNKYTEIKIDFTATEQQQTQIKSDTTRVIPISANDSLSAVIQQHHDDGNWNYLTQIRAGNENTIDNSNTLQQQQQHITATDDVFYNAIVDCVAAVSGQVPQQQLLPQQQNTEEEDDDPIHTFLNIESYFEKELIILIQQEDILYNSFHPGYRNIKLKIEAWDEIARKLKKQVKQCRLKWKALRDQYIREHKRLKNRENAETLPRWKHYDALNFLQKFIKHKSNDFETKNLIQIPKTELDEEIDENIVTNSPLHSPMDVNNVKHEMQQQQLQMQALPSLNGTHAPHHQQQQQQTTLSHHQQQEHQELHQQNSHDNNMCIVSGAESGASAYDEMDIDNYIIGDGSDDPHDDVEEDEDRKSQQQFPDYTNTSNDNNETEEEDFKDMKSNRQNLGTLTQHTHLLQQQHHTHQQLHRDQTNEEHILPIDVTEVATLGTTEESLQHNQDFSLEAPTHSQASTLINGTANSNSSSNSTNDMIAINNLNLKASSSNSSTDDDDEVGVFFKAVAMKIRSAKLSPIEFTDLQINILQVINGSLRNH